MVTKPDKFLCYLFLLAFFYGLVSAQTIIDQLKCVGATDQ